MSKEIIKEKKKENPFRKKARTFSFTYEDGHRALDYLESVGKTVIGGKSGYIVKLLLEDMERKQS